jgi:hypothetical protein
MLSEQRRKLPCGSIIAVAKRAIHENELRAGPELGEGDSRSIIGYCDSIGTLISHCRLSAAQYINGGYPKQQQQSNQDADSLATMLGIGTIWGQCLRIHWNLPSY